MSFEVREKDLLARIGRLQTKTRKVETPLLFPVINPAIQPILPKDMGETFGFEALITNAYILKKHFQNEPIKKGLHRFLDYDRVIMTDSGAYQILTHGNVEISPREVVEYQESIDTDIATILDWPTGWKVTSVYAEKTVNETLKRAKQFFEIKTREDILWVGPVQGGKYLDLVTESAREMGRLPFQVYALGSPTEVMENYRFDVLVDMIMTAKMNLPIDKPLHLFGAGHPFMFSLAIALGCDLFDSAAYAIYARENRYMTENGTHRLGELDYFPCTCPRCARTTPKQTSELTQKERETFLSEHNLYVCSAELRRIKQAIKDGRLWEHLEMRSHSHPALLQAVKKLRKYEQFIEKHSPIVKNSGLFFFSSVGLSRPEVVHHAKNLRERYVKPKQANTLLLIPQTLTKPFHKSREYKQIAKLIDEDKENFQKVHVCFYAAPFGVVPIELDEVYPLSQHETTLPLDKETIEYVANQVANYISRTGYGKILLMEDPEDWNGTILNVCRKVSKKKNLKFKSFSIKKASSMEKLRLAF